MCSNFRAGDGMLDCGRARGRFGRASTISTTTTREDDDVEIDNLKDRCPPKWTRRRRRKKRRKMGVGGRSEITTRSNR